MPRPPRSVLLLLLGCMLGMAAAAQAADAPANAGMGGDIFVIDMNCCGMLQGGVIRVNPATGAQTVVSSGQILEGPRGVVLAPDGMLYLADLDCCGSGKGGVIRVDPSQPNGSNQTLISSAQSFEAGPSGIVATADGMLYAVDASCCGGSGGVIRVDPQAPNGSNQTVISSGQSFAAPFGIALGIDGLLYVVDQNCCGGGQGGVIRVDPHQPNGSNQAVVSSGQHFGTPVGLAFGADGNLYVADSATGVIRVNPAQDALVNQTLVSSGQHFIGGPSGIALGSVGRFYVVETDCCAGGRGAVIQVDQTQPNGGNQFLIATGGSFNTPVAPAVVPGLTITDAVATEGTGSTATATFTIFRGPWSPLPITATYAVGGGTAVLGQDVVPAAGSVTFGPGETIKTLDVQIIGDTLAEPSEIFAVTLQAPNGVGLHRPLAIGTITDDDGTAGLAIGDVAMLEGDSTTTATFTVVLLPPSGQVVTVEYTTSDGAARAPLDYQATSGTLTFQPGETSKSVQVTVVGDTAAEPDETFTVTLGSPTGGAVLGRAQATGVIRNDDAPRPCTPRPSVRTVPVAGGGRLAVSIEATPLNTQQSNPLIRIELGAFQNATVTMNGQPVQAGQVVTLPPNTHGTAFTIQRVTAGQPTTVHLTVVDGCGAWPTFVGGGPSAGF